MRRVFGDKDNFAYFSIKTYVVGTHKNRLLLENWQKLLFQLSSTTLVICSSVADWSGCLILTTLKASFPMIIGPHHAETCLYTYTTWAANNKGADQTARMCRLSAPLLFAYGMTRFRMTWPVWLISWGTESAACWFTWWDRPLILLLPNTHHVL